MTQVTLKCYRWGALKAVIKLSRHCRSLRTLSHQKICRHETWTWLGTWTTWSAIHNWAKWAAGGVLFQVYSLGFPMFTSVSGCRWLSSSCCRGCWSCIPRRSRAGCGLAPSPRCPACSDTASTWGRHCRPWPGVYNDDDSGKWFSYIQEFMPELRIII